MELTKTIVTAVATVETALAELNFQYKAAQDAVISTA
jgi:hypothetical protein